MSGPPYHVFPWLFWIGVAVLLLTLPAAIIAMIFS